MASDAAGSQVDLYDSAMTVPSDSENYSANNEMSSSPSSTSSSPMILYQPPTIWGLLRGAAINLFLPFVNGLMLGFGELFAHEAAFRLGWSNTKIFPMYRRSHPVGPGVDIRELPSERRRATSAAGINDTASLE
ncbi:Mitochondrial import protein 1 [Penicillium cinerascens]|uniref:Mitochondrial import protein 1 n=1 Tax=Penicillium cinerascens TaxID=70096 RepID=A0A9W9J6M7_9EURO|nr:Mitochondrial import protein 1 [Penicillium cinerascens]KAJ5191534.1 Mitochondrial import protein 1 [Penicillium cinerascens]